MAATAARTLSVFSVGVLAVSVAVVTGCGTGSGVQVGADDPGRSLFLTSGCGACHTLAAAGTTSTIGPDLDGRKLTEARVVHVVTNGLGAMQSYEHQLEATQIQQIAAYVVASSAASRAP